jgi:hypothetical protein
MTHDPRTNYALSTPLRVNASHTQAATYTTMTPRTRNRNKDADFKVYYSKTVPQQVYFPHKRKIVRRPRDVEKDGMDKRQMKFLPEKMTITRINTVGDSEDDDNDDLEEGRPVTDLKVEDSGNDEHESKGKRAKSRGKKRRSDAIDINNKNEDTAEPTESAPKRRRKAAVSKSNRRSKQVKVEPAEDDNSAPDSIERKVDRSRTIRRQSTMTQLVEGRRPMSDTEEPAFKPVKRSARLSWGGQSNKGKDRKQRTLTQMVPGMRPLEIVSDDDVEEGLSDAEAENRNSQAYGDRITARLAQEGLFQDKTNGSENVGPSSNKAQLQNERQHDEAGIYHESPCAPSLFLHSIEENNDDDEDEESYQPTQFIDAPSTRTRRNPRRISDVKQPIVQTLAAPLSAPRSTRKSKFGLLSTPEKRRVRVIPSSQSPPDSPISTQVSPTKAHRSPLRERSGNDAQVAETPSRRKQVTFQEPMAEPPPSLRKFKSVIQDSEDEEDDLLETNESGSGYQFGTLTQGRTDSMDNAVYGKAIGTKTQAVLGQIDQACASRGTKEATQHSQGSSIELAASVFNRDEHETSPELGEPYPQHDVDYKEESPDSSQIIIKREQPLDDFVTDLAVNDMSSEKEVLLPKVAESVSVDIDFSIVSEQVPSSPPIIQQPVEDTCPSTPMVIMDSSDEEDDGLDPTPPHRSTLLAPQLPSKAPQLPLKAPHQSADVNVDLVQVPQSPPTHLETQESHSSKAEQQLHNEWFSYSQYINTRPPQSSSMNVAHDKFSYDATPLPPRPVTQIQPSGHYTSQATTVDEMTPRKNRTQHTLSAHTTPRKVASSQPCTSPSKPPPLFIPSSFPSPTKARMEDWSSPVFGNTQFMHGAGESLEDFSIPLPPPAEDDWMDGA